MISLYVSSNMPLEGIKSIFYLTAIHQKLLCFCISSPIFSSHKLPIVKNIHVICKGLRHFLNLFKKCNVKLSNISILFVCYAEGDNNIFLFSNVFTPGLCLLNELVMFLYMIWGKSESIFCDWLIFSLNYLHWI